MLEFGEILLKIFEGGKHLRVKRMTEVEAKSQLMTGAGYSKNSTLAILSSIPILICGRFSNTGSSFIYLVCLTPVPALLGTIKHIFLNFHM